MFPINSMNCSSGTKCSAVKHSINNPILSTLRYQAHRMIRYKWGSSLRLREIYTLQRMKNYSSNRQFTIIEPSTDLKILCAFYCTKNVRNANESEKKNMYTVFVSKTKALVIINAHIHTSENISSNRDAFLIFLASLKHSTGMCIQKKPDTIQWIKFACLRTKNILFFSYIKLTMQSNGKEKKSVTGEKQESRLRNFDSDEHEQRPLIMLFLYWIRKDSGSKPLRINTFITLFFFCSFYCFIDEHEDRKTFPTLTIHTLVSAIVMRQAEKNHQPKQSEISQVWTK